MEVLPPLNSEDLKSAFLHSFFECLEEDVEKEKQFLFACDQLYISYMERMRRIKSKNDRSKYINETDWLKNSLYKLLEEEFPEKREVSFEEEFEHFINVSNVFLINAPFTLKLEQEKERFAGQATDSFWLSIGKFFKRIFFQFSRLPRRIANWFRKDKKEIRYWTHNVPLRSMLEHYFANQLVLQNLYAFEELMKAKCRHLNLNWKIIKEINLIITEFLNSEEISSTEMIKKLEELEKSDSLSNSQAMLDESLREWKEKGELIFDQIEAQFRAAIPKVNTIELSTSNYGLYELKDGRKQYLDQYKKIFGGWKNSIFAQLDDIQIDIELYHIKYFALMQYFLLRNSAKSRIEKTIQDHFIPIQKEFDELISTVKNAPAKEVMKLIVDEKDKLGHLMTHEIIPKTIEGLYEQDFPNLLDRMEFKISKAVGQMREERIIYAENKYDSPIKRSELSQFNPRELVEISILKNFSEELTQLKASVVEQLELLQSEIYELSGIIEYNLDSALNSQEEDEKIDIKEIACEGIQRTKAKSEKIQKDLIILQDTINNNLKETVENMSEELIKLTVNENITDLRLRLATAKAKNKTFSLKEGVVHFYKENAPKLIGEVKRLYKISENKIQEYLITIGIIEENKVLTAELSDFLLKTNEAIAKLPYVYKRLYRIDPLSEEIFFEGRQMELDILNKSYSRWKEGSFEATIVVGEKGSGTSSLINFFIEQSGIEDFSRRKLTKAYSSADEFYSLFSELAEIKDLKSQNELVEHLMDGDPKVIIIEDAQHLYLKRIGGFRAMQMLFDLISETSSHVFWIIEVTSYTYDYLEKTIRISSYFKNKIKLQSISDEQMVKLIMKRHRVSGYNLEYVIQNPGPKELRKLRKLDLEGRQEYLKENYFKKLNDFAKSNISLALLYWLRSTLNVKDNTIEIGMLGDMKFEFLSGMSDESIFTLHALLLHDSLSVKEHAILFHQSEWQSKMNLMVLEDNGILILEEDRYKINRLLYRQVVNVLQQKNIIH